MLYSFARTADAPIANVNAVRGSKLATKVTNNAPKAPMRRCRAAERVKVGFAIGITPLTVPESHIEPGTRLSRLLLPFQVFPSRSVAVTRLVGYQGIALIILYT